MATPRFFLVMPADLSSHSLKACAEAAVQAGDCASILVPATVTAGSVAALQSLGLAVIIKDCEPRLVHHVKADGIQISRSSPVKNLRVIFKTETIGVFAASSRHIAMEAAEAGADYIAFAQKSQTSGEPMIGWWHDIFEIPVVAFDPVTPNDLATLLPQKPDFIRPGDEMWSSPEMARQVLATLQADMTK